MNTVSTFFFNHIIGKRVIAPDGKTIGRLKDLIADPAFVRPKIVAAVVLFPDGLKTIDFSDFKISAAKNKYTITCGQVKMADLGGAETIGLARQLLNKQIVDMNKKRLVHVNDLKIAVFTTGTFVVAVDSGIRGRLRKLHIEKFVERLLKLFDVSVAVQMVLWDDIETINIGQAGAGLTKSISNLDRLHPSDMADIIEEMDHDTQVEVFSALDMERAADVLEELESETRENLLESLPKEKMADVLEIMPADEVADILDEVDEDKAEELLKEMESQASGEVRDLMEYEDYEVGSLMSTEYICFHANDTVSTTLAALRREKPDADMIYYLYIVTEKGELKAMVSLRDIVVSSLEEKLDDIMDQEVVYVHDTDRIETLNDIIDKYNLLAVPVVDTNLILLGVVIINDVVYNLLRSRRKRQ